MSWANKIPIDMSKSMGKNPGGIVLRREEHTDWLSTTKCSALKVYTYQKHYTTDHFMFQNIYAYTYIYIYVTINKKGHEFERAMKDIWEHLERGIGREIYHNLKNRINNLNTCITKFLKGFYFISQ